jgi:NAD-dependent dihydropyrimidine dehydrogenase PreA subunit
VIALPTPRLRAAASGRPTVDPGCAGCAQLGLLRALRRAGLEVRGGLGCESAPDPGLVPVPGHHARVAGARELLARGPVALLSAARRDGARLVVIADRLSHGRLASVEERLARCASGATRLDPDDLPAAEAAVRAAAGAPGAVLLSFSPCVRGWPRAAPLAVDPSRCNRCGACLTLACPALFDPGGEAVAVDPGVCTGCGRCAPLCRSGALAAPPVRARAAGARE